MNPKVEVAPEIEAAPATQPVQLPKAEYLQPFVMAAREVLEIELGSPVQAGKLQLAPGSGTTQDITAIIGITGQLTGMVMYGLSEATAKAIVGQLMGSPCEELDDFALSGIGEIGNVIAGRATMHLAAINLTTAIAPPVLLVGAGSRVSTAGISRLAMPLVTSFGTVECQLAIKANC